MAEEEEDEVDIADVADRLIFSRVGVARRDLVFVTAHPDEHHDEEDEEDEGGEEDEEGDEEEDDEAPVTYLLQYEGGEWGSLDLSWPGPILAIRPKPLEVDVIGLAGEVLTGDGDEFDESYIDRTRKGPSGAGFIRGARHVGSQLFAVGMSRQAYRRDDMGWRRIDQGIRERRVEQPVGFEAVDGFSEEDVYTVGLQGEIFRYDGAKFRKLDSPTNLALRAVRCVSSNEVYVCGTAGILLKGHRDDFEPIEHEATDESFYSLEWYRGRLYVASLRSVYRLEKRGLVPIDFGHGLVATAGSLHAGDGVLWSCGGKHLSFTADGVTWTPVPLA